MANYNHYGSQQQYESSERPGGLRAPRTLPKCLPPDQQQALLASQGVGRGRGRGVMGLAAVEARTKQNSLATARQTAQQQAQKMHDDKPHYIPGLTERPVMEGALTASLAPKEVPTELIEEFLSGSKNPVSALMEYCAITRLKITFGEVPCEHYSLSAKFACVCTVQEKIFPQGTGKTKKEAKTNAAKIAFTKLLGLAEETEGMYPIHVPVPHSCSSFLDHFI